MSRLRAAIRAMQPSDWLALALLLLYVLVFSTLTIRQHQSFNTNALDLGKFDQSIWNTAQGRPFQITISENLVIESHFSPSLALFAPLYWIWSDIRLLFIMQSILLGGAGFLIYWFFRRQNPWLGLVVFAAYLMNPALHQVNLVEFRRLTLAVFATSFALYHLLRRQYGWMALGLALALLSKEDMSLTAVAFGLYILLVQRNLKVGIATVAVGIVWFILVPFVVLPAIMTTDQVEGYQHANSSYSYLGTSLPEIVQTVTSQPGILLQYAGQTQRLQAVFNFLWPAAFLFLLAPEIAFFLLPHFGFLLASTREPMGRLQDWYPSVIVIILYWAVAVGATRLSSRWQRFALVLLLILSFVAWISTSELWPGSQFDITRYQVTEHERQVEAQLARLPDDAIVMAQDPLVPHLSHRENIYLFPWVRHGNRPDIIVLERKMRPYPLKSGEYRTFFYNVLAGTEYDLTQQVDSLFIFEYSGEVVPDIPFEENWADSLRLYGYDVDFALPGESFQHELLELPAGTILRVSLYWEILAEMDQNYTVFVHALSEDEMVIGQHDSWPADTHRPTSVLSVGEKVRDVHYLTLEAPVAKNDLMLRVGVYESNGGESLLDSQERSFILLPATPPTS
jgi:uncharacterized membrane protein